MFEKPRKLDPRVHSIPDVVRRSLEQITLTEEEEKIVRLLQRGRDLDTLRQIHAILPPRGGLKYDAETLRRRSERRIERAISLAETHAETEFTAALDVGCARAENFGPIRNAGMRAYTGIDLDDQHFPEREEGMTLVKANVEDMPFENDTFDFSCSFNVLEHVSSPEKAISDIIRVLKPGGVFCTTFGPQFNAANGPHLTRQINLPFMHHLFREEVVAEFVEREEAYCTVNRHPLALYRDIFFAENGFRLAYYREHLTGVGFGLLKAMPELSVHHDLDELAVNAITVVLVAQ
ncbi:class I SAM-dependent methyltransferase [Celeribacter sp. ULVN23_4]